MKDTPFNIADTQNFIKNKLLVKSLIQQSSISSDDVVVEIGPGGGIITAELLRACKTVIAVELDNRLFNSLEVKFNGNKNLELVHGDFLKFKLPAKIDYKVFSNIPFNRSSAILNRIANSKNPPLISYLIVQEEFARKEAGLGISSLVSILNRVNFKLKIVHKFSRSDFRPIPRVNIVMLEMEKRPKPLIKESDTYKFKDFISFCFLNSNPNLQKSLGLLVGRSEYVNISKNVNFKLSAKPTEINFEQWLEIFKIWNKVSNKKKLTRGFYKKLLGHQSQLEKVHRTRRY